MDTKGWFVALCAICLFFWAVPDRAGGGMFRWAENDVGGQGAYVNLIVRQLKVTPIRAHAGDPVRIEMTIEHQGEGYDTTTAEIRANGKVVADSLFTYGFRGEPGEIYHTSFVWDTKGVPPGTYRISGEVFLWYDADEFDNSLTLKEPLVLLSPGQALSTGAAEAESAVVTDPRWSPPHRRGQMEPPEGSGGY